MVRKSQEKLRRMTKVRKIKKKISDFVCSNIPNSLYLKISNGKNSLKTD